MSQSEKGNFTETVFCFSKIDETETKQKAFSACGQMTCYNLNWPKIK